MAEFEYESFETWSKMYLRGQVTYEMTPEMKTQAEELLGTMGKCPTLVCDLSQVSFLDSSGIGFLVFLNNKVRQKDGCCYLYQPSEVVMKTLDLVQLTSFFELIENDSDLITRVPM